MGLELALDKGCDADGLDLGKIVQLEFGRESGKLPHRLQVGAPGVRVRMCDEKKSRIRARDSGRAVKTEDRAVPGTSSAEGELGCMLATLGSLGQPHPPECKSGSGGSE